MREERKFESLFFAPKVTREELARKVGSERKANQGAACGSKEKGRNRITNLRDTAAVIVLYIVIGRVRRIGGKGGESGGRDGDLRKSQG